jgi:acetyltransferase-like isoleucine patch superfamily enzyme
VKFLFSGRAKIQGKGLIGKDVTFVLSKKSKTQIGAKLIVDHHTAIMNEGELTIGYNLNLNQYSRIVCKRKISIGDNVLIARFVSILDHDHHYEGTGENFKITREYVSDEISIGNNVWLGDKVTVVKGVRIGNNVIVAANSVVVKDVPDNVIVAGIPAKIIKEI